MLEPFLIIGLLIVGGIGGCQTPGVSPPLGDASSARSLGDRSDIEAAVAAGVDKCALAIAGVRREPGLLTFTLLTPKGQPGVLTASFDESNPDIEIRLETRLGRFGNAAAERELLDRVSERLRQLRGVSVAPLRW
ncbi:MAG: hypothetical protein H6811_08935 [Phycisphaeraceae bacterium]|nr:hypothetical protein [Phycisphaeraceae bacterium]